MPQDPDVREEEKKKKKKTVSRRVAFAEATSVALHPTLLLRRLISHGQLRDNTIVVDQWVGQDSGELGANQRSQSF